MTLTGAWNWPTRILSGPGRIKDLASACRQSKITHPLVVTDRGLLGSSILATALAVLRDNGFAPGTFGEVKGNPTGTNVMDGVKAFHAGKHDGVVAFGGGSGLDVGKAVAFMAGQTRPIWDYEDVGDWWTRADASAIKPIVAVPTTAGTGSEVGRASVITNEDSHEKKIIFHPLMLPRRVILDPELSVGLPPHLTAATGMDAFTHCFEAYCAPGFHPPADGVALEGMRLVAEYLPRAFANGSDIEARSMMLAAACMGATAFQKGLGAVHSIAHPVGALFDTHHGLANGILLPYVMVRNKAAITARMETVARLLDLKAQGYGGQGSDGSGFDAVMTWLLEFRGQLGIPHSLGDIGITEERAPEIGIFAERDPSTGGNPVKLDASDMEQLFRLAVRGTL